VGQWRVSKFDKNKPSKIDFPKGEAGSGTAFLYLSLLSVTRGVTMPSYFLPIFPAGATVITGIRSRFVPAGDAEDVHQQPE
jgi:hypothetical protein